MIETSSLPYDMNVYASDFKLKATDNRLYSLDDIRGKKGTLIMFICNHCPYVVASIKKIVELCDELKRWDIKSAAIMPNDTVNYPQDSFANMIKFAHKYGFNFPYLYDETQNVARNYNAICTPDFFGFDEKLKLRYRGRIDNSKMQEKHEKRELFEAMKMIATKGSAPLLQHPSIGCSIKWKT